MELPRLSGCGVAVATSHRLVGGMTQSFLGWVLTLTTSGCSGSGMFPVMIKDQSKPVDGSQDERGTTGVT